MFWKHGTVYNLVHSEQVETYAYILFVCMTNGMSDVLYNNGNK